MNFNIYLSGYLDYLSKQNKIPAGDEASMYSSPEISIFMNFDLFKTYLIEEEGFSSDIQSMSMSEIMSLDDKGGKPANVDDAEQEKAISTQTSSIMQYADMQGGTSADTPIIQFAGAQGDTPTDTIMLSPEAQQVTPEQAAEAYSLSFLGDMYSDFSEEDMSLLTSLFDTDGSGNISQEEQALATSMLSVLDGNTDELTADDLDKLKNYLNSLKDSQMNPEDIIANIYGLDGNAEELTVDDFNEIAGRLDGLQEAAQEGIQGNTQMEAAGAGGSSSSHHPAAPAIREKNLNNMSIEDLEKEKEAADEAVKTAQDAYLKIAEELDAELTEKIKDTQSEINDKNSELDDTKSQISDIESQISDLKDQKELEGADTAKIDAQIKKLEDKKAELEEKAEKLEDDIKDLEDQMDDLNKELSSLATSNPELKAAKSEYDKAVEYQQEVEGILELRKADRKREEESNRPDVNQGPKDYRGEDGYNFENLPMTYELNGETYHCVGFHGYDTDGDGEVDFKPDSWEEMQRYFANAGIANIGKYGTMQCHNYSNVMVDVVMGTINSDILNAMIAENEDPNFGDRDLAGNYGSQGKYNPRDCLQCKVDGRDGERAIIENELQNGRPCLVSVPYPGGCHWVTAVGIADNGDILIWDSYDGSMQKLGKSSSSDTNEERRNMATGNGVMVIVPGSSYQYATHGYLNYWFDWVGKTAEYAIARDKANR